MSLVVKYVAIRSYATVVWHLSAVLLHQRAFISTKLRSPGAD